MLKVYFIISLVKKKKEIILDLMLEERDCFFFFPLTRLRLMFWLHSTEIQRVLMDPCCTFFFRYHSAFFLCSDGQWRKKGNTKGISSTFQSWNFFFFVFVVDVFGLSLMCPAWIFAWPASLWIERRGALRTL